MTWASSKLRQSRPRRLDAYTGPPTPVPGGTNRPTSQTGAKVRRKLPPGVPRGRPWSRHRGSCLWGRPAHSQLPPPGWQGACRRAELARALSPLQRWCTVTECRGPNEAHTRAAQPGPARGGTPTGERCRDGAARAGAGRLPGDHAALSASHKVPSPRRAKWSWPCSPRVSATKWAPLGPAPGRSIPPGPRGQGLATLPAAPGRGSNK